MRRTIWRLFPKNMGVLVEMTVDTHLFPALVSGIRYPFKRQKSSPWTNSGSKSMVSIQFLTPNPSFWNQKMSTRCSGKTAATFQLNLLRKCNQGDKLIWFFTVNSDITFEIVWSSTESSLDYKQVWPKVTLTSLKTPEIGHLACEKSGVYRLRFANVIQAPAPFNC